MAVLYTTHYTEEAERLCDRIGVIDHGKLIAEGTRRQLLGLVEERSAVALTVSGDTQQAAEACAAVPGVTSADNLEGSVRCLVDDPGARLRELIGAVNATGATVAGVDVVEPNLESVFLHLTGQALRD